MEQGVRYSYEDCIEKSEKVSWKIADVLGEGSFDLTRAFLPESLAQVGGIECLSPRERLQLNQLRGLSYAHLFGFVEEFIVRKLHYLAGTHGADRANARRALLRFTEEEVKHQMLFEAAKAKLLQCMAVDCKLVPGASDVAGFVLSKSSLGVVLLTMMLEWTTQLHYADMFRARESDQELDPTFVRLFQAHWMEEAQHVKVDHLEIDRLAASLSQAARDEAVDEVFEIGNAFDGLLRTQAELDIQNLSRFCGRTFTASEAAEILGKQHQAYRFTFLTCGLTHPKVMKTFQAVSPRSIAKLSATIAALSA